MLFGWFQNSAMLAGLLVLCLAAEGRASGKHCGKRTADDGDVGQASVAWFFAGEKAVYFGTLVVDFFEENFFGVRFASHLKISMSCL